MIDCILHEIKPNKFIFIYIRLYLNISKSIIVWRLKLHFNMLSVYCVMHIGILRRSVQVPACELRSEPILCNFGWCLYQNNPGLSWSLNIRWPMHGNLDVTIVLVLVGSIRQYVDKLSTQLWQNYDKALTHSRSNFNKVQLMRTQNYPKHPLGAAKRPPSKGHFAKFGFS